MLWLQAFAAVIAWILSSTAAAQNSWIAWTCDKLNTIGAGELGICSCRQAADASSCWSAEMVYRAEAAMTGVFVSLFVMSLSGCALAAARSHSVAKFMAVVLVIFVSFLLPNAIFDSFGTVATATSAIFLVAQAVLLIDFSYSWNELWYGNALAARRREPGAQGYRQWLAAMLVASSALCISAYAVSAYLYAICDDTTGRVVNVTSMILSIILLVVSITDWCEHGALLTSSVVTAYTVWLLFEALAVLPNGKGPTLPAWVGLTLCSLSLLSATAGAGTTASGASPETTVAVAGAASSSRRTDAALAAAEAGTREKPTAEAEGADVEAATMSKAEGWRFAANCLVHAAASMYIAASMAPRTNPATFGFRTAAIYVSLALYGWSLVAPKVLSSREFR